MTTTTGTTGTTRTTVRATARTTAKATVAVRMYNVGFGDAFLVTVRKGRRRWRMLVDCGVHAHGQARPLQDTVEAIIADLEADAPEGEAPHLDVVAATHHHADHIAGFALDSWERVAVDEVWVPFVEDVDDPDAVALRQTHAKVTNRLLALLDQRTQNLDPGAWPAAVVTARWFAANSRGNDVAADRLLGRNGRGFASTPRVRYLPSKDPADNTIDLGISGVTAHVLGPSRDPADLKRMEPPARAGWLTLDDETQLVDTSGAPLFNPQFTMSGAELRSHPKLLAAHQSLANLDEINDAALLAAASILERSVNNTSLFFVLDVDGVRLLFPGDAQQGAWDHVLEDPQARALLADLAFYKISHHGSHNGTPRRFVEEVLRDGIQTMLPWGLVKRWADTIPKAELLEALAVRKHHVIRADSPVGDPPTVTVKDDLWSEVNFTAPAPDA